MIQNFNPSVFGPELQFTALFEALPGSCILLQNDAPNYTVLAATPEYLSQTGYRKEAIIGKGIFEMSPPNPDDPTDTGASDLRDSLAHVRLHKEPHHLPVQRYDIAVENGSFSERYWSASNKPVFSVDGEVIYIIHAADDITSEVKAGERELAHQELQFVTDTMPQLVWASEADGYSYFFNKGWLEYTGLTLEEVKGNGWTQSLHPEDLDRTLLAWTQAYKDGATYEIEFRLRRYDGDYRWFLTRGMPKKGEHGNIVRWYGTTTDVHEQKKSAEALLQTTERFNLVSKATQDAIWDWDLLTDEVIWNEGVQKLFGYELKESINHANWWYDHVHPEDRDHTVNVLHQVLDKGGNSCTREYRFLCADGSYKIVYDRGFIQRDEYGKAVRMLGSMQDITERKQMEEALRESEERFRTMANTVSQSIWITDAEGRIEFLNKHWLDYCGELHSETDASDISVKHLHPDDAPKVMQAFKAAMQTGEPWEIEQRNRSKEGEYRWFLNRATPYKDPNTGKVIKWFGVGIDIHDRKLEKLALEQSEEELEKKVEERTRELERQKNLLNNILVNSSNGISVTEMIRDKHSNIIDTITILANDAAVSITGLSKEVYLTKKSSELDPNILQSSYGQMCLNTLRTGEPSISQYYMELTGRWLELSISKMDDEHLIHIFTDITPVKEAQLQLEKSVDDLKRSNQNLEEFAYAASHDLKEPIRKIHFFTDRLKARLQERLEDEDRHYFERLETGAKRMSTLIDDLLMYSHINRGASHIEAVDLNNIISLVEEDLELAIEDKKAKINVEPLPNIRGHKRQLQQLFENLVGNALKYSKPGIQPQITIKSKPVNAKDTILHRSVGDTSKQFYLIEVLDNGIGFDSEDADRIFNVFTRLHGNSEYKGTGVGLSIARKVAENHNGYIWAESKPSEGSTFKVLLPVS